MWAVRVSGDRQVFVLCVVIVVVFWKVERGLNDGGLSLFLRGFLRVFLSFLWCRLCPGLLYLGNTAENNMDTWSTSLYVTSAQGRREE